MTEKEELRNKIERQKNDLKTYLEVFPLLGAPEEEKERVINQILDDILKNLKRLKEKE